MRWAGCVAYTGYVRNASKYQSGIESEETACEIYEAGSIMLD
jgi:hypothetical protein